MSERLHYLGVVARCVLTLPAMLLCIALTAVAMIGWVIWVIYWYGLPAAAAMLASPLVGIVWPRGARALGGYADRRVDRFNEAGARLIDPVMDKVFLPMDLLWPW